MKKIILSLLSAGVIATSANAQISFAHELGLNMADLSIKSMGHSASTSMKAGIAVGGIVGFELTKNIYLEPGIFYLMNGCNGSNSSSININTIQVPVNVEYKLNKAGENRIFFGAGPFIAYNISATSKSGSNSVTMDIGTDKNKDAIKPLDFGFGINGGYQLAMGLFFRAHYQLGLAELDPRSDADNTMKSSSLGITVGYYFGANNSKKTRVK